MKIFISDEAKQAEEKSSAFALSFPQTATIPADCGEEVSFGEFARKLLEKLNKNPELVGVEIHSVNFTAIFATAEKPQINQVWRNKDTEQIFVIRWEETIENMQNGNYEKVANFPHENNNYSYLCGSNYCRCMQ